MQATIATLTIEGITPYSASRQHDEPKLDGESPNDYDKRTWRSKLNVEERNGQKSVVFPAHGVAQALAAAAKYSKKKIPGQRNATWTQKFVAGVALLENPSLNVDPATVSSITVSCNADGVRGSGKRVPRIFPVMPKWSSTFEVYILDPSITREVFEEMVELAGMFIGLGRFRPEKGGTNGRFRMVSLDWHDNRAFAA